MSQPANPTGKTPDEIAAEQKEAELRMRDQYAEKLGSVAGAPRAPAFTPSFDLNQLVPILTLLEPAAISLLQQNAPAIVHWVIEAIKHRAQGDTTSATT